MRRSPRFLVLLALCSGLSTLLPAQAPVATPVLPKGFYIVVAAYFPEQNQQAEKFASQLRARGATCAIGKDPVRNFIYVWLERYEERPPSIARMEQSRLVGYPRAWVRVLHEGAPENVVTKEPDPEIKSVIQTVEPTRAEVQPLVQQPVPEDTSHRILVSPKVTTHVEVTGVKATLPDSLRGPRTWANTRVFLRAFHATTGKQLEGDIQVIDAERARLVRKTPANAYTKLTDPGSKKGKLLLVAEFFGYRKLQLEFDPQSPPDSTQVKFDPQGGFFVPYEFDLVRLHRGDIATMYNVYFFKDAAVMQPESQFELNSLLTMLRENPGYRIRLHGHTNGNSSGPIISVGPDKKYFSLSNQDNRGFGSAKKLSLERASTIRSWLLDQGVDAARIEVKGWGGSRMIHDKHSNNAHRNVRVDVEVLSD